MTKRLAVDIGGTFVDAVEFDHETGELVEKKAATTPDDPTQGVINAIERLDISLEEVASFVHGTTLGLNALLERDGATTGIITNEGFRDVFEMGRHNVPAEHMYDITYQRPELLVPRRRRLGVPGRLDSGGSEVEPLDQEAVLEAARALINDHGVESIAICFLNAYQEPKHERLAAEIIREHFPDISLSLSSDITREYREYERTSTTALDAYITPIFESYVDKLGGTLKEEGFDGSFFITRSGGGSLSAENAKTAPAHTIFSGPAGGLIGSAAVGDAIGRDNLIAVDMGGTSLDTCVIQDGEPAIQYESELENQSLLIPVYDLRTIGAGGGSIAWLDRGLLKVGPESAGADPGPICYGKGGTKPTVTDAAVALGYVDPSNFLGGAMDIDTEGARAGIDQQIAEPLGMSVQNASRGIFDVMLANTVSAIREITVERGLDPRDFSMISYGGAGPMVIPLLAREMNVKEVVIPQAPGVFSAWGMLMSDVVYDLSRTHIRLLENTSIDEIDSVFEQLETQAKETLDENGYPASDQRFERSLEMRYRGQEHAVEVPFDSLTTTQELTSVFEAQHESRYGHAMNDPAETVHLRIRAVGRNDKPDIVQPTSRDGNPLTGTRNAYCFAEDEEVNFDVYDRGRLDTEDTIDGPAIIQEPTTTVVIYSDQEAIVDEYGHLVVTGGDA
ncbi:hydantoinase/oxoprolinase family protein [Natrialbaceae archaeon A-CW2]